MRKSYGTIPFGKKLTKGDCDMTLREKYGEWGIILGATEGVGKAFAEKIASEKKNKKSNTVTVKKNENLLILKIKKGGF